VKEPYLPGFLSCYLPQGFPADRFLNPTTPPYFDGQTWHFFSYQAVLFILEHPEYEISYAPPAYDRSWTYSGLWSRCGADHRGTRQATAHAYTPRAIAPYEAQTRAEASRLLTAALEGAGGRFEFINSFAAPLVILSAARVLGVHVDDDIADLVTWMQENVQELARENLGALRGQPELRRYIAALLVQRTKMPQGTPTLMDDLIANGQLTDLDRLGLLWTQLIEAPDTLASSIGYTLLAFLQFGLLPALRADRSLLPGACEEALRFLPAFPRVFRRASKNTALDGCEIAEGQAVTGWLCAANRDPGVFPDPDRFDISRENVQEHLAFGGGPHVCLGKSLAQLVLPAAFNALLDAFLPTLRLDPDRPLEGLWGVNNTILRLHLRYGQEEKVTPDRPPTPAVNV
jgi:cytochrome P450